MIHGTIRPATMSDCADISHIHRHCEDPWRDADECAAWIARRLERGFYIQAAEVDGRVVGHGEWIVSDGPEGRAFYLGLLQVDADCQRMGIGRAMIRDGLRAARAAGADRLVTIPDETSGSAAFYEKCGFVRARSIWSATLPARNVSGALRGRPTCAPPEAMLASKQFVLGAAQASARHMYEVCNHPPRTDARLTHTEVFAGGDIMQLSRLPGQDHALALYFSESPDKRAVAWALGMAARHGIERVAFYCFEEFAHWFEGAAQWSDVEMIRRIGEPEDI